MTYSDTVSEIYFWKSGWLPKSLGNWHGQYLERPPLASITARTLFVLARSPSVLVWGVFAHFLVKGFYFCETLGCLTWTALLRSFHRLSMMLRSGNCEGHGENFSLRLLRSSVVDFEVCFNNHDHAVEVNSVPSSVFFVFYFYGLLLIQPFCSIVREVLLSWNSVPFSLHMCLSSDSILTSSVHRTRF